MNVIQLPVADIKTTKVRQRKELGEETKKAKVAFEELKSSIKSAGLLQPIGVAPDNELIWGFRRLTAFKELGLTHIPAVFDPDKNMTDFDRELMELDENIQRLDLSWHEREEAIATVARLRQQQDPSWTQRKTAEQLGVSQATVSRAVNMEMLFKIMPELKEAKTLKAAVSKAKQMVKVANRKAEVKSNPAKYEEATKKVIQGFAEIVIQTMPDACTKHIITDGPFGIDYDNRPAAQGAHEAYADSPEAYMKRTELMAPHMWRIMGTDGFLIWFLAHDHYEWTKNLFRSVGFLVDPVPIMWDRSDGRCYTTRPDRYLGKGYDIALHCIKGDPQMVDRSRNKGKHGSGNVFRYKPIDPKDKEHIVERPIELYQDIVQTYTLQGEKVTDFFGGSGKIAAACASLKRDHFTVEMNPNHIPLIVQNIYANTPQEC